MTGPLRGMPRTHHHHYNQIFPTINVARSAQFGSSSTGRGFEPLTERYFSDAPGTWDWAYDKQMTRENQNLITQHDIPIQNNQM
uniref:Uncharacterized protein n=1 Tax=Romanomermis culicivorax TaxID=13658 RepID=A0A915HNI3_ROMCU